MPLDGIRERRVKEIALEVPPVAVPGRYALRVDLVDEGVKWFESLGSPPLEVALEVGSPP